MLVPGMCGRSNAGDSERIKFKVRDYVCQALMKQLSKILWFIEAVLIVKIMADNHLIIRQIESPLLQPAIFVMVLFLVVKHYDFIERFIRE